MGPAGLTFKLRVSLNDYFLVDHDSCAARSQSPSQHVRRDLGANEGSPDHAVDTRYQRRVVGVIVGTDTVKEKDETRHVIVVKMADKAASVLVA